LQDASDPMKVVVPPAVEYLGNKRQLLPFLMASFRQLLPEPTDVIDLFSGTATVAAGLKSDGHRVIANDHLAWCAITAEAVLLNDAPPRFPGLAPRGARDPYRWALEELNSLPPEPGFVHRHYSPASAEIDRVERRYFTEHNAARIDAIRACIEDWRDRLSRAEYSLLVSDLLRAVAAASNVAATYGCYLKGWKRRALEPLSLTPTRFVRGGRQNHEVHSVDAAELIQRLGASVVYADPPYTKRQYAAYYHILETIALADRPSITGSTGLRPWKTQASDWCYKRRAPSALVQLLEHLSCDHFFLSYSEDGQISHDAITEILESFGPCQVVEHDRSRYRSSSLQHKGALVRERLYYVKLGRR
jgi:adenine-specific DNA-methyltransferase